jgi:hypothetical protein
LIARDGQSPRSHAMPYALLIVAAAFALSAAAISCLFLSPVRTQTAHGVIVSKTFKPAGTYSQYPVGVRPGFRTANEIPIAECYVFEINVDGMPASVHYALNTVASEQFQVGQRVRVEYQQRGIPLLWSRIYILDMKPEE